MPSRQPFPNRKVLIVEDEEIFRRMLVKLLTRADWEVQEATQGHEALARLEKDSFAVMVLDLIMPEKEGLETLQEVRRRWPDLPILAISGGGRVGAADYLRMATGLGAHGALSKPFDTQDF